MKKIGGTQNEQRRISGGKKQTLQEVSWFEVKIPPKKFLKE